ncbi:hypothetical protein LINGRAHAP2_LOCUS25751 [Linum grandiflorum]
MDTSHRCGDYSQHRWFGSPAPGRAAGGENLRNPICQAAFAANFGTCTITHAELRAALHELRIAWDRGYKRVHLQVDFVVVVSFLRQNGVVDPRHQSGMNELQEPIARNWTVSV